MIREDIHQIPFLQPQQCLVISLKTIRKQCHYHNFNSLFNTLILLYVECIPLLLLLALVTTKHSYVHHMTSLGTVYSSYMHSLQVFSAFHPGLKISVPYKLIYTLIAQYYLKNISQFCFPILLFIFNLLIKKANTSFVVCKKYIQMSNFYH